ncbi:MAG: IS110 family transposase, partial [Actinomycetota bacterium]|nr:IS110 family transposase [Actinomycetota bacterium]
MTTIIGIDPYKRSHTAVVLDECEQITMQLRVEASPRQVNQLLAWAPGGARLWAIENANGLGRLLAQQLIARGEPVVECACNVVGAGPQAVRPFGPQDRRARRPLGR